MGHVAVVFTSDDVRFVVAAETMEAITGEVASYVARVAEVMLTPDASDRVRALLEAGRPADAVSLYFDRVGERWDRERLQVLALRPGRPDGPVTAASAVFAADERRERGAAGWGAAR